MATVEEIRKFVADSKNVASDEFLDAAWIRHDDQKFWEGFEAALNSIERVFFSD